MSEHTITKPTPFDCSVAAALLDLCHGTIIRPAEWIPILQAHKDKWVDEVKAMDAANGRRTVLLPEDEHDLWTARFPWESHALSVLQMMVYEGVETAKVVEEYTGQYDLYENVHTPTQGRVVFFRAITTTKGGA